MRSMYYVKITRRCTFNQCTVGSAMYSFLAQFSVSWMTINVGVATPYTKPMVKVVVV